MSVGGLRFCFIHLNGSEYHLNVSWLLSARLDGGAFEPATWKRERISKRSVSSLLNIYELMSKTEETHVAVDK